MLLKSVNDQDHYVFADKARALFVPYQRRNQGSQSDINGHEGLRTKAMNTAWTP